jgi:hypothetical protein
MAIFSLVATWAARTPTRGTGGGHQSAFEGTRTLTQRLRVPPVPADLELPVLNGTIFKLSDAKNVPVVFNAFDNASGFSRGLWGNPDSVDELIIRAVKGGEGSAPATHFVFLSHAAATAELDVSVLQSLVEARFAALMVPEQSRALWRKQLHYVTSPTSALPFVRDVLDAWPTVSNGAIVHRASGEEIRIPRLDARYDWVGWAFNPSQVIGSTPLPVVAVGDACQTLPRGANVTGKIALAVNSTRCGYFEQLRNAQAANASAIVVWAAPGQPLVDMNCKGAECDDQSVGLAATMIPWEAGTAISDALSANESVGMSFTSTQVAGTDFAIDAAGALQQSWGGSGAGAGTVDGNPGDNSAKLFPRMSFLAWAGRFLLFERQLSEKLSQHADEVLIFDAQPLRPPSGNCYGRSPWGCGPWSAVAVPPLAAAVRWELLLELGCNGSADIDCPQWDHVVQLRACVLAPPPLAANASCNAQDGPEIARWVTSFSRRIGRWVVDITPIAPLLASKGHAQMANFTIYSAPWAGNQGATPWLSSLTLRTVADKEAAAGGTVLRPWAAVTTESGGISSVFKWVAFNASFDTYFPRVTFDVPATVTPVRLFAYITGHGNDNHGCGEFCATEHRFRVNSNASIVRRQLLPLLDQQVGCAEEVDAGVTPNEYGTCESPFERPADLCVGARGLSPPPQTL